MVRIAPRVDERLRLAAARLDSAGRPIAEINRRVGAVAAALGLPKPSYEEVRRLVHAARAGRHPAVLPELLAAVGFRHLTPDQFLDLLAEPDQAERILGRRRQA